MITYDIFIVGYREKKSGKIFVFSDLEELSKSLNVPIVEPTKSKYYKKKKSEENETGVIRKSIHKGKLSAFVFTTLRIHIRQFHPGRNRARHGPQQHPNF
jgi:hypothetical protein